MRRALAIDMATILVVDDDPHIREVARFALARAGHVVELAGNGVEAEARPPLVVAAVAIDRDRHEVRVHGEPLPVTATELRLLAALALHRGRVLSRGQLIAAAYPDEHHVTERTIDTHVRNLRAKLAGADIIETVHGVGYRCA